MRVLVTGAAGFIGCNLVAALLISGKKVVGIDNLSRGSLANLSACINNPNFQFIRSDIAEFDPFSALVKKLHAESAIGEVWHLAANSDIPAGVASADIDLRDTFMTTYNLLQVMKELQIPVLAFASSSAIYGNLDNQSLVETIGPLLPISNYGAMKLASEAAITAAVESYLKQVFLFRFPNVIGVPATHGVIYDFVNRLRQNPKRLDVLGNGTQQKAYLHVDELIDAMLYIRGHGKDRVNYFNIGADDEGVSVKFIAEETVKTVAPGAVIGYGTEDRGWVGDVPRFRYSIDKLRALGWKPKKSSREAVSLAVRQISAQEHL